MTEATALPVYLQMRYQQNGVFDRLENDIQGVTNRAKQQFDGAFAEIDKTITRALSTERNSVGALDLGVDKLRSAQRAQEGRAAAAEEVARVTRRAAQAEGDYSQQARSTVAASDALAVQERRAAKAARERAESAVQVQIELNR